jgi:hypothetical protein
MNFRLVWMGPDDDPNGPGAAEETAGLSNSVSRMRYGRRGSEMIRRERLDNGRWKMVPLANFSARIVRDLIVDDDQSQRREFEVRAEVGGHALSFLLSAAEFSSMHWVLNRLGPEAILYPGQQQHVRAAIQSLSGRIHQERIFTHLGWAKQGDEWVYLQAEGAVGATGEHRDLHVRVPAPLAPYQTRVPRDPGERVNAIRSSLRFLSLAADQVTIPLLATLCQQHFGAALDARRLPANFASTPNALEGLAFAAKDALLVVDDFAPTGAATDSVLHSVAERLFRSAGNHQGRSRLSGSRVQPSQPPRALILATGEEVPRGQSLRARLLILELSPGDVDRIPLSECQQAAQDGQPALAMGSFLSWVAGQYEPVQEHLRRRALELRSSVYPGALHARLPTTLAELRAAWEIWLQFALEAGAIHPAEHAELLQRCERALHEVATLQAPYQQASDPALRFVALLRAALAGGRAHVADRQGGRPEQPTRWGWHKQSGRRWVARGSRIGWVAGGDLFLDPSASYQVAQHGAGAERLPLSEQTLRHRLHQRGLLASLDASRHMLLVRRILEGCSRQVIHLRASDLR